MQLSISPKRPLAVNWLRCSAMCFAVFFSAFFSHKEIGHVRACERCFYAASYAVAVSFLYQSVTLSGDAGGTLGRCGYAAGLKP